MKSNARIATAAMIAPAMNAKLKRGESGVVSLVVNIFQKTNVILKISECIV
jgi:hypothetical protein